MNRSTMYIISSLGIGAVAGLLWAPQSGAKTRAAIRSSAVKGRKFLRRRSIDINEVVTSTLQQGATMARQTARQCNRSFRTGRSALNSLARQAALVPKALAR